MTMPPPGGTCRGRQRRIRIPTERHSPGDRLSRLLARQLDESWQSYARRIRQFSKPGAGRPVHKLRVSARRLLTNLELMTDLDADSGLGPAREALAEQFKAMGALRDAQVQLEEVEAMALPKARRKALRRALRRREGRLGAAVLETTGAGPGDEIRRVCDALASAPSDAASNRRLRSNVNRVLRDALLRAKRLRPRSPSGLGRLHRARIALKRLRYLSELVRPVAPGADRALFKRLAGCQTIMGDIHDTEVLLDRLKKWRAKGRIAAAELRKARAPLARRHRALVRKYFVMADALFAGKGPLVQVEAG